MHPTFRKVLATGGGIAVTLAFLYWALTSSGQFSILLRQDFGLGSSFPDAIGKDYGDLYSRLSVFGLSLAAGLSFTLLLWERRPPRYFIQTVYWILLVLLVPLSLMNFFSADAHVSRGHQALLNLLQAFIAALCTASLLGIKTDTQAGHILKAAITFFLVFQGILIPLLFTIIWWLNWQRAISLASADDFSPGWISAVASAAALLISILQYRIAAKKAAAEGSSAAGPSIVLTRN